MSFGKRGPVTAVRTPVRVDSGRTEYARTDRAPSKAPAEVETIAVLKDVSLTDFTSNQTVLHHWYALSQRQRLILALSASIVTAFVIWKAFSWLTTAGGPRQSSHADLHQIRSIDEFAVVLPVNDFARVPVPRPSEQRITALRNDCVSAAALEHGASLKGKAFANQRIADDPKTGRTVLGFGAGTRFLTCLAMRELPRFCEPAERQLFAKMLTTYVATQERVMKEERITAPMDAFAAHAVRQLSMQGYLRPADFGSTPISPLLAPHLVAITSNQCKS